MIYFLRPYIYTNPYGPNATTFPPPSRLQNISLVLIFLHFLKREYETVFIHRFSVATMPVQNIFKNCFHYWVLGGANLAYWIYSPTAPTARPWDLRIVLPAMLCYIYGEVLNLMTHMTLRDLRKEGGTERGIPEGMVFEWVTCPNYMFETLAWVGIALMTWSWSTVPVLAVAVVQMMRWAKKREMRYRKEFPDRYLKKKYVMLPGIY